MSAEQTVIDTINAAQDIAAESAELAQTYSNDAQRVATIGVNYNFPKPVLPGVPEPEEQDRPTTQGMEERYWRIVERSDGDFDTMVDSLSAEYLTQYMPCYDDHIQQVCDVLGGIVNETRIEITQDYENMVWERERTRTAKEISKQKDTALNEFAARGFSMPSGVLVARIDEMNDAALETSVTQSREVAIKHLEHAISSMRWAIETINTMRKDAREILHDLIKIYTDGKELGHSRGRDVNALLKDLYQNMYDYYNTYIRWGEFVNRHNSIVAGIERAENAIFTDLITKTHANKVNAAIAGAKSMGDIAAAAWSAQNSMASIGSETINEG